jgi:hypothetical protein
VYHRLEVSFYVPNGGVPFNPSGSYFGVYSRGSYPVRVDFLTGPPDTWGHSSNGYTARLLSGTGMDGVVEISFSSTGGFGVCRQTPELLGRLQFHKGWKVLFTDRFEQNSNALETQLWAYRSAPVP